MKEPMQAAEELLILRAQLGDETAFQRLVQKHTQQLFVYCRSFNLDTARCEDVIQDVWLVAFRSLALLRSVAKFRSWLYGIARNKARQHLDKKARHELFMQNVVEYAGESSPEPSFKEYLKVLPAAFEHLSINHREILTLRFLNQMSYAEIADLTGIGVGTVKSRIHYAKIALHEILESMNNGRE
ncbi:MAG: RNA polymerase sigma factor [Planctomycetota bacterium]|jgi:RNA polymerase sigma-70 factor (ECF subfamily)